MAAGVHVGGLRGGGLVPDPRRNRCVLLIGGFAVAMGSAGCSAPSPPLEDGATPPSDAGVDSTTQDSSSSPDGLVVPLAAEIEPGVWRELVALAAPAPQPNPATGAPTPAELNRIRFLRYRRAAEPTPVRAIALCLPGMPAGAMAFDQLARRLVHLSDGSIEVWAVDRRANLLEDLTGMQAAERAGDPDLAWRYYTEGQAIAGQRYAGGPGDVSFMSEWGIGVATEDLRVVLGLIPESERQGHVVLVGHSFGASLAQAFAAWDLDGAPAAAQIAGLVLLDGGLHLDYPIDQQGYEEGPDGLSALREGSPYLEYFGFGAEFFMVTEIVGMTAHLTPERVFRNTLTDRMATLLFLRKPPPLTAAAMVGFAIDESSSPMLGMRARCGAPDGPVEPFISPLTGEQRFRPADSRRTYGWLDHDEVTPQEKTSIAVLGRVAYEGPTNRVEWYMPARLPLDARALSLLDVSGPQDWRWAYGLRASRNAAMDAPVLAVLAGQGLVRSGAALAGYRQRIAEEVGAGRPRAGATRDPSAPFAESGFVQLLLADHAHDDVVHAVGPSGDAEVYAPLLQWILSNAQAETITIPAR